MIRRKIASIVLAGTGLIACSYAWAWTKAGGKVKFSDTEWGICLRFLHDIQPEKSLSCVIR